MSIEPWRAKLVEFNNTHRDYPVDATLHGLFESQVQRTPNAVAAVFEDRQLTYRQLDDRATALANQLRTLGLNANTPVGVCLERSLELPVSLLGVLKAGGGYVALDPNYPTERLRGMIEESGVPILITSRTLMGLLPNHSAQTVYVDADSEPPCAAEAPFAPVDSKNLAYVIYTSGSTGRPKGVMVSHRAVTNRLFGMQEEYRLSPRDAVLQKTPYSFDVSVWEFFWTLMTGARMVIARPQGHLDHDYLIDLIRRQHVTTLHFVPPVLDVFLQHPQSTNCTSLKRVFCGGESLPVKTQQRFFELFDAELYHLYGPTEAAIDVTSWVCLRSSHLDTVPIGRPVANVQIHILDPQGQPVPPGTAGELFVGGAQVAIGYLNRPDLTAERFLPDPFCGDPEARLYRTGDLGRWRDDGNVDFLGRIDQQVKIRGVRIELEEIEAILNQHPSIRLCAVMAEGDGTDRSLVAYLCTDSPDIHESSLRSYLSERLPESMIPNRFVTLAKMPLSLNGKIDRAALRLELPRGTVAAKPLLAPRNDLERQLAEILQEVLNVGRIGIDENFFALGGHSLRATVAIARMWDRLGTALTLSEIFENPTIAQMAAIFERRKTESSFGPGKEASDDTTGHLRPLRRVSRDGLLPASFAQERMWFFNQLEPESVVYNISWGLRLSGPLNVAALELSLQELVRRHESLRTTIHLTEGCLHQVIASECSLSLPTIDIQSVPHSERESKARVMAEETALQPFDLSRDLMMRALLIRLAEQEHVLVLVHNHIASDGWSLAIFDRELAVLYEAYSAGRSPSLPELPVQYVDYAVWQREWLRDNVLQRQLAYWKQKLASASSFVELPTDYPPPKAPSSRGVTLEMALDVDLTTSLQKLSDGENVTLFMTLLAAWQLLLSRYTGQNDVAVGAPIAGRNRTELQGLIGLFVNTLVLRTDLSGNPTFLELLKRVREVTLGAFAHQDLPFEKLVEELNPPRLVDHHPYFDTILNCINIPQEGPQLSGLKCESLWPEQSQANFLLTLYVLQEPALRLRLVYQQERFSPERMHQLLEQFRFLLKQAVTDPTLALGDFLLVVPEIHPSLPDSQITKDFDVPDAGIVEVPDLPIGEVPQLSESERNELLVLRNDSTMDEPLSVCVHELLEEQVKRTPEVAAAVFEGQQLTYRELNDRANRLAIRLIKRGVGPGVLVGLCLDRSLEMLVGLLGILKAGGAYVPLDPSIPFSRLQFVVEDAKLRQIATTSKHVRLLTPVDCDLIEIDDLPNESGIEVTNPVTRVMAGDPVYVMYTSGSTGRPKGVVVEHRQLVNYVEAIIARCEMGSGGAFAMLQPLAFDSSQTMIFPALTSGGTVHLIDPKLALNAPGLADYFFRHSIDYLKITPSHLTALLDVDQPQRLLPARALIFGGEPLHWNLVSRIADLQPRCRVWNHYGPTETTVGVCTYPVDLVDDPQRQHSATVPIGRPLANVRGYVLDNHGQVVPVGVAGELHIAGRSVSRGYLNRPEATAQRFVCDHFSDGNQSRLYRTGDFVRRLPGGDIEFLGRQDGQVKIRGIRIETGEIEAVLNEHPQVLASCVLLQSRPGGDPFLAAYLVSRSGCSPTVQSLIEWLTKRLPDAMRPATYTLLPALPMNSNGKVDRNALPVPELDPGNLGKANDLPQTPLEEHLVDIWGRLLGAKEFGVNDNFFELGGQSLLAIQLVSRIKTEMRFELPIQTLFEFPTIVGLARQIEENTGEFKTSASYRVPINRAPRNAPLLPSYSQQRAHFIYQLVGDSVGYNVQRIYCVQGLLDEAALERSLQEIVRRHESLRTTQVLIGGQLQAVILEAPVFQLSLVDLRGMPEPKQRSEARRLATAENERRFDLTADLMLRATVIRLDDLDQRQQRWLVVTMHHIASDGWSAGIFERELTALYEAYSSGQPSPLSELPYQYTDYAFWQRELLRGEVLERQLTYWRGQLDGTPGKLSLPSDFARPKVQSFGGATQTLMLDSHLTAALHEMNRREEVTLFMTLLATWQVLLSRYSGQADVSVGVPIAGRNRVEFEGLIGFFANTLVLRTDLSGNPTVRELLQRVRNVTLGALTHEDLPFDKLVEELKAERNQGLTPFFNVMFALQNAPTSGLRLATAEVHPLPLENKTARFDVTLTFHEQSGELLGNLEYNTELFRAESIARMAEHFRVLLAGMIANPAQPIGQLPIMKADERKRILVDWNHVVTEHPRDRSLHELIELHAERAPATTAVVFGAESLTYAELNSRANRLAHALISRRIGPESLVGICLERSVEMFVGVLAVLKAGGAYLPLDPDYPAARLQQILQDADPAVVLTTTNLQNCLLPTVLPLHLDDPQTRTALAQAPSHNPSDIERRSPLKPEHPAYVIYTSGSTGVPKGVVVTHAGIPSLSGSQAGRLALTPESRVLQYASLSFDASFWEILMAATAGAALVLRSKDSHSGTMLAHEIKSQLVTHVTLPPTVLATLDHDADLPLEVLIVAGETCPGELVARWSPKVRLVNAYGPTESTVCATMSEPLTGSGTPTIGTPICGTRCYVLDQSLEPVPIGVPGELYIAGLGLARGYLHQPELTTEKFVTDPFGDKPGARMYRTGDRAKWRADGTLEFLGRLDDQIKLRGFRIELGEIEAMLAQHTGVRQAAVLLREDRPGDKRLIAYIVPQTPQSPTTPESLRYYLQDRLPHYMVPATVVRLERMPTSPSGKVDRKALPAPEPDNNIPLLTGELPRNPFEELLASIWSNLLKVERIGINRNFFDLGGHSLLAAQLVARVRDALSVDLPLRALFEAPTVAELAARIEELLPRAEERMMPLRRATGDDRRRLSFAQERLWFLDQLECGSATYNISWCLRLQGNLDHAALEQSFLEILRRHEALRTTIAIVDGQPQPVVLDADAFRLEVTDLREVPHNTRETEAQRLAANETGGPFDLASDLMLRARLLQLAVHDHVLVVTMHHIASDGWSVSVFDRELETLYQAYARKVPSPLPELSVQYLDYAVWQRTWLQGEALEDQMAYWKRQLEGAPAVLELPTDFPRPAVARFRGARQQVVLDTTLTQALNCLSRHEGVTLFMTLLAAWQILLSRYSRQEDISVGSPIAGRNRTELEGLIGFFVNTLVLRTDLSGNPTFRELLRRVRKVALDAYSNQDLPFAKLVEELRPERSLSHTPLFQVMFALQNAPSSPLELEGLTINPLRLHNTTSKFDLTLSMSDTHGSLQGTLEYDTDLFETATIKRLLGHFQVLLASIVADPEQRINELPLLTSSEQHQLLVEWNNTQRDFPKDKCVHELFEEQVQRTPHAVAIVFEDRAMTYHELNTQANRLANHLIGLGVMPETLVGLCVERSLEMIVGLLGILKAGGAYVPLDPASPPARLDIVLREIQPPVLLTQGHVVSSLPPSHAQIVCLDDDWPLICRSPDKTIPSRESGDRLAYVMYTSGSTGTPKGVSINHRGITRLVSNTNYVNLNPSEIFLQLAPLSFDAATFEIWGALLNGARLVIAPPHTLSLLELGNVIRSRCITTLWLTAGLFHLMVEERLDDLKTLRQLLAGGDVLSPTHVGKFLEAAPSAVLVNGYGPTENTTFTCCYPMTSPQQIGRTVSIGRPIANSEVYILDAHLQPVPVGIIGELYAGGAGLARGYYHDPELTAEKFISHPFQNVAQARLYKTGDLCRYLKDGTIEFVGRVDNQIKLRGFRIELGEIEAQLALHPDVRQSVVQLREDHPGDKRLVAYIVAANSERKPSASLLRDFLNGNLPEYMIPSAWIVLEQLPLTPNGKVDRKALPAPNSGHREHDHEFFAPRDADEEQLASLWSELLEVDHVGIHDNLFLLGGHSLLVAKFVNHARSQFNVEFSIRDVFQRPTVAGLAGLIKQKRNDLKNTGRFTTQAVPEEASFVASDPGTVKEFTSELLIRREDKADYIYLHAVREGAGQPPIICVGDARFIPLILEQFPEAVPVLHLRLDGCQVWPPLYLTVEEQVAAYVSELKKRTTSRTAAVIGYSYGGLLAHRLASALLENGWELIEVILIEPPIPGRQLTAWCRLQKRLANSRRWIRKELGLIIGRRTAKAQILDSNADQIPDGLTRWRLMEPQYIKNSRLARLVPLSRPIGLIGRRSYLGKNADRWKLIELGPVEFSILPGDVGHLEVFRDECGKQCVEVFNRSYNRLAVDSL